MQSLDELQKLDEFEDLAKNFSGVVERFELKKEEEDAVKNAR